MIMWLWIGGGIMALGTLLALTPSLRRKRTPGAPALDPPPTEDADDLETVPA